jgi:hypothetical protein
MVADGIRESRDAACQMVTATEESLSRKADRTVALRAHRETPYADRHRTVVWDETRR